MKKKILVVEDEPSYIRLIHDQLAESGYDVIEARDGKEGLDTAKRLHPDLLLLDIRMPVMDGISMLDELRKDSYGKTAKVIILTNLEPDDKILQKVLVDQPTYYLVKNDVQLADLLNKIKELFVN